MKNILLVILLLFFCPSYGQMLMPKIPPSPNAASLGEYGLVPIDHYVGAVTPKIDVYEYDLNGFKFNINFTYRNTGVRYTQESSNVGLGWVLNAGGVITRAKNTWDDFEPMGYSRVDKNNLKLGETDLEPDIFYYNFNGISGRFLMPDPYTGKVLNQKDELTIRCSTQSFFIHDAKGVEYIFSKLESTSFKHVTNAPDKFYVSAWYLTKIILPNKQEISFTYNTGEWINQSKSTIGYANYIPLNFDPKCPEYTQPVSLNSGVIMYNEEIYLTKITANDFSVDFQYDSRIDLKTKSDNPSKRLVSFVINQSNTPIRTVELGQSYFSSSNNQNYFSKRLKLDRIKINDEVYSFEYNEAGLPDKNSLSYNGFSFIESAPTAGILTKISYPTKGFSKFLYELNSFSEKFQYSENVSTAGMGIRISSVENYDHPIEGQADILLSKKIFEYTKGNGISTGKLITASKTFLDYVEPTTFQCRDQNNNVKIIPGSYHVQASYKENTMPLGGSDIIVGYDRVTIRNIVAGQDNGKEEYLFRNNITQYPTFLPGSMGNVDFANGTLLSQTSYKYENSKYTVVKKDSMFYQLIGNGEYPGVVPFTKNYTGGYKVTANKLFLKSKLNYEYHSGLSNLVEQTDYSYLNDKILVKEEVITNSLGQIVKTRYKYPSEYATTPLNIYKNMTELNMLDIPIETVISKDGKIVSAQVMSHKMFEVPNIIRTAGYYQLNIDKPLLASSFSESFIGSDGELTLDSRYLLKQQVLACDAYGNVTQIKSPTGTEKNLLWGYNGQYPVIEIDNASNDKFNESISEQYDGLNLSLPGEATLEFKVGGSGSITLEFRSGTFLSTNDTYYVNYWITGPKNFTGYFCRNNSPGTSCYNNPDLYKKLFMNMPPGVYKLRIQSPNSNQNSVAYVALTYPKKNYQVSIGKEFFYEGFENDNTAATAGALMGSRYRQGTYAVPFKMPTAKKYIIDYKYRSGGKWLTASRPYVNDMTLSDGDAIDEVRVYPIGAKMTTYTYKPLIGMTSRTDGKGMSEIYEYDAQGRLMLIKDNKEHITKAFRYNIKAN